MPALFLSYRRADSQDVTGRIYDRLVARYSEKKVFKDVDSIPLGVSFPVHLRKRIGKASAVLVVIGPNWVNARDDQGRRRLDDPDDFVRMEVEIALGNKMPVIPVLVSNARMPTADELPESLQALALRNGLSIRPDPDFNNDIVRLFNGLEQIDKLLESQAKKTSAVPIADDVFDSHAEVVADAAKKAAGRDSRAGSRRGPPDRPDDEEKQPPPKSSGWKMAGLIGGAVALALLSMCGCSVAYTIMQGGFGHPVPKRKIDFVIDRFVVTNLGEKSQREKSYTFTEGSRVVITSMNELSNPMTDVDLLVFRGGAANQSGKGVFRADVRLPAEDRNCRVEFVVPATGQYWVRVLNLGPGMALSCTVNVIEQ